MNETKCSELREPTGSVVLEGKLEVVRADLLRPIECQSNCRMTHLRSPLCGVAWRKDGVTSIAVIEELLEHLNGKYVRVTVEVDPLNAKGSWTSVASSMKRLVRRILNYENDRRTSRGSKTGIAAKAIPPLQARNAME